MKPVFRRLLGLAVPALVVVSTLGFAQSVSAATFYYYNYTSVSGASCTGSPGAVVVNDGAVNRVAYLPGGDVETLIFTTNAPGGGNWGASGASFHFSVGPVGPGAPGVSTGGDITNGGTAPVVLTISVTSNILNGNGQHISTSATITCSAAGATPTISISNNSPTGGTAVIPGPPIPGSFVLHTITCTVAVFDSPGGNPVGSNVITGGQTWFVNPTPVLDKHGKSWTEVFVGGYINGYIPTSCVH